MESRKMVLMNIFAGWQWRHRWREQSCEYSEGRRGWGELREYHRNIPIAICKIGSQAECAV